MRVLVADKFESSGLTGLKSLGAEVIFEPDLKDETLDRRLQESRSEVLIVRSTKVTAATLEGSSCKLVIRAGAGYNTIDVGAASRLGIFVSNCPGKNAQAVAELAFGLLIAADRHIPDNVSDLRAGKWNKKAYSKARGLFGRTLGLVGFGNIGKEMVPRAKAFGMPVLVFSEHLQKEEALRLGVEKATNLEDLATRSDFVSVHSSLTPERKKMLGAAFFNAMKNGSVLVNTSRGEVVDQDAMLAVLERKQIVAALDVFDGEPPVGEGTYDGPLRTHPFIYATHHIGASTEQAQEAVAAETVRIVSEFMAGNPPPNAVNASSVPATAGAR